jgi:G3E family GTPase
MLPRRLKSAPAMNAALQQKAPVPLFVLTGFLGSGKTTLLNRLLADPSMRDTAVIVNEFGDIGVDHLLVASATDDVVLLASGCVCCSVGDDLATTMASMLNRRHGGSLPPFQRIVLETSGVADPGLLLQRVLSDAQLAAQTRIQAVVTVFDAVFGEAALSRYTECATQVAVANRLVVSKLDLIDSGGVDSIVTRLRSMNPAAPILLSACDRPSADCLFGDTPAEADFSFDAWLPPEQCRDISGATSQHADRYRTFWLAWNEPTDWDDFKAWLEGLLIARGDSILRLKGILQVAGRAQPIVIQGVQHALYPPRTLACWPRDTPRSEMVFVTRDFSRQAAARSIQQFLPYRITVG